jgi:hypothetical protein
MGFHGAQQTAPASMSKSQSFFFLKKGPQSSAAAERRLASRIRRGSVATWGQVTRSGWEVRSVAERRKQASLVPHTTQPHPKMQRSLLSTRRTTARRCVEGAASTQAEPATFYAHAGRVVFVSARQDTHTARPRPRRAPFRPIATRWCRRCLRPHEHDHPGVAHTQRRREGRDADGT